MEPKVIVSGKESFKFLPKPYFAFEGHSERSWKPIFWLIVPWITFPLKRKVYFNTK